MEIGKAESWAQFGLAGLVIFSLFILIVFLLRREDVINHKFCAALNEMSSVFNAGQKEMSTAINTLALTIERKLK